MAGPQRGGQEKMKLGGGRGLDCAQGRAPAVPHSSCITLNKTFGAWFPQLLNGDSKGHLPVGLL